MKAEARPPLNQVGARAEGVPCSAPCPPSPAYGRLLLLYLRGTGHPLSPSDWRPASSDVVNHWRIRRRMAGIRFPEVKEEGRCFFGPGDMEGIGYPPSVARADSNALGATEQLK
jgi:hypothetical protein